MSLILLLLRGILPVLSKQQSWTYSTARSPTSQIGGYFPTKIWEPKSRTRWCCRLAQKRIFWKSCYWKDCTTAGQLGTGEAPGNDQYQCWLNRVLQIQAILSLTDPSANGENCCKGKPRLFSPTAWFFQTPLSDRDFPPFQFTDYPALQRERLHWV